MDIHQCADVMGFEFFVGNLPGVTDIALPLTASRCGATGVVNLEYTACVNHREINQDQLKSFQSMISRATRAGQTNIGFKLGADQVELFELLPAKIHLLVLSFRNPEELVYACKQLRGRCDRLLIEVHSLDQAKMANAQSPDGWIVKGNEAGGWIGEETSLVLLQQIAAYTHLPVIVYGGISAHTIAACYAAGARGVLIDVQFALFDESVLPAHVTKLLKHFDGDETQVLRFRDQSSKEKSESIRAFRGIRVNRKDQLLDVTVNLSISWANHADAVWPLGQDAAFALKWAEQHVRVSDALASLRTDLIERINLVKQLLPLGPGVALARDHGTAYPIVQGPMTRVSDVADFALAVAEGGGLPFLALSLLNRQQVRALLEDTDRMLGDRPWGVGILGFVSLSLREAQLEVVKEIRPRFALIAGGRPDQAASLDALGIVTYLHVPSPRLLSLFIDGGARRFVVEGAECGGHVGPRSSFVLWSLAIDEVLQSIKKGVEGKELSILFAGGIGDARAAAMLSMMLVPLTREGVKVGVLMGTAYLFTNEAVESGAILPDFQTAALQCSQTVSLESGPGYVTRCADTEFAQHFAQTKSRMLAENQPSDHIQEKLEDLNVGRLRIATKGLTPGVSDSGERIYLEVDSETRVKDGMYMMGQIAALRDEKTTIEALHRDISDTSQTLLLDLADSIQSTVPQSVDIPEPLDIAIVGMGCLLPKASSVQDFWHNLLAKLDTITEIPRSRFDASQYFDEDRASRDRIYVKWGGFLDAIDFDPLQYGIPPTSLDSIDPFQLLCLEVVRQSMADSGYLKRDLPNERTGVILGASGGLGDLGMKYGFRAELPQYVDGYSDSVLDQLPEWTEDSFAGILLNVAAGRVANRFDLGGVNFTVDAACASSLAAVYLAAKELSEGNADVMIAGGVDTVQSPFGYLCFSKTRALSPEGRCKTFDQSADGTIISEGLVTLIMKRLDDAERDGDKIYAVLKSVAGSSDGRDKSLTAPRPIGQRRALERAYAQAGISAADVGMVEAHGTGTVVGDSAELEALSDVYRSAGASPKKCALGSVKSAIGHTKAAAGVAGIMKSALALHHKVIPPTLHVTNPIPELQREDSPFFVTGEALPWMPGVAGTPRYAAVSAFGFGGTNFHAVLEEYTNDGRDPVSIPGKDVWESELFTWRRSSLDELHASLKAFIKQLDQMSALTFAQLANYVWEQTQADGEVRLAIVASERADLINKLNQVLTQTNKDNRKYQNGHADNRAADINDQPGVYFAQKRTYDGDVGFLFSGQGSQYPRMCRDLFLNFGELRLAFEAADKKFDAAYGVSLSSLVMPGPGTSNKAVLKQIQSLTDTSVAQPAIGALGVGLVNLLNHFGLKAKAVVGHSYGEYLALYYANVIDEEDLLNISQQRGRIIKEAGSANAGSMLAVLASQDDTKSIVDNIEDVWIANYNSPKQTVLAGTPSSLEAAAQAFSKVDVITRPVPVSCAFHSPLLGSAAAELSGRIDELAIAIPDIPVFSNATGVCYPSSVDQINEVLSSHITEPVRFIQNVETMYESGIRWFVEVGPKSVLGGLVRSILDGRDATVVSIDSADDRGLPHLQHTLAQLWSEGVDLDFDRLYRGRIAAHQYGETQSKRAEAMFKVDGGQVWRADSEPVVIESVQLTTQSAIGQSPVVSDVPVSKQNSAIVNAAQFSEQVPHQQNTNLKGMNEPIVMSDAKNSELYEVPGGGDEIDRAMQDYQKLMTRFLETERDIMMQYLGSNVHSDVRVSGQSESAHATPSSAVPHASASLATRAPSVASVSSETLLAELSSQKQNELVVPSGAATDQAPSAPSVQIGANGIASDRSPESTNHAGNLRQLISDRTGYPVTALDPQLNLEADLGIDSIKKVEILTAYRQACTPQVQQKISEIMDLLVAAKSLSEIETCLDAMGADNNNPTVATSGTAHRSDAQSLIRIVSERTGYPEDMLAGDLAIEGDLGIDSIKRVEIITTYLQTLTETEQDVFAKKMELLTTARTIAELQSLIDMPETESEAPAASQTRDSIAASVADAGDVNTNIPVSTSYGGNGVNGAEEIDTATRHVFRLVDSPLVLNSEASVANQLWIITDDGKGLADTVQQELREQGARALILAQASSTRSLENDRYQVNLTQRTDVAQLLDEITSKQGNVDGIVHMLPLSDTTDFNELDAAQWHEQITRDVYSLYHLTALVVSSNSEVLQTVVAATRSGSLGVIGSVEKATDQSPHHGGVIGYMRSLNEEYPAVKCRLIDFAAGIEDQEVAGHICSELIGESEPWQVLYAEDGRKSLICSALAGECDDRQSASMPSADWVILLTGGARGITAEIAIHLARAWQARILLVGRSALPDDAESAITAGIEDTRELKALLMSQVDGQGGGSTLAQVETAYRQLMHEREIRTTLKAITDCGASVEYQQVDVSDHQQFKSYLDSVYLKFNRLDVVVHGAGVVEDKLLCDKTPESFARVLRTKTDSAYTLCKHIRFDSLKTLIFMSSVTAAFGNRGQIDYGTANGVLNSLAIWLSGQVDARIAAYNWAPWDKVGMARPEIRAQFKERGIHLITPEDGAAVVQATIETGRSDDVVVVVGDGPWADQSVSTDAVPHTLVTPTVATSAVVAETVGVSLPLESPQTP